MINYVIILILIVSAFISGILLDRYYNDKIMAEARYCMKILAADKGLGYIAPPMEKRKVVISQEFMDKLRENGRAIQALK